MISRGRASLLAACVLVLSGCASTSAQMSVPRPAGLYDTAGRGPDTISGYLTAGLWPVMA